MYDPRFTLTCPECKGEIKQNDDLVQIKRGRAFIEAYHTEMVEYTQTGISQICGKCYDKAGFKGSRIESPEEFEKRCPDFLKDSDGIRRTFDPRVPRGNENKNVL